MENTDFNLWQTIRNEAEQSAAEEPMLASFLHMTVLRHDSLERVLAFHLSSKLANPTMDMRTLYELYLHALEKEPCIGEAVRADITAYYDRPGLRPILPAAFVFQRLPRHSGAPHQPLPVEGRAQNAGLFPAKPRFRSVRRRYPSGRPFRAGDYD